MTPEEEERRTRRSITVLKVVTIMLVIVFFGSVVTACNMTMEQEKTAQAVFCHFSDLGRCLPASPIVFAYCVNSVMR
jgi:hypothetical protein